MSISQHELSPYPFCGGEVEERGDFCTYGKHVVTLDLKCRSYGTGFKFKAKWQENPYREAVAAWNRRVAT